MDIMNLKETTEELSKNLEILMKSKNTLISSLTKKIPDIILTSADAHTSALFYGR
jgi:hypothetical protein